MSRIAELRRSLTDATRKVAKLELELEHAREDVVAIGGALTEAERAEKPKEGESLL